MKLNVNPNRMELLKLKKRLSLAKRGHKLLKDKQDELMKQFMNIIDECKTIRIEVEENLQGVYNSFILTKSLNFNQHIEQALLASQVSTFLEVSTKKILNLEIPKFVFKIDNIQGLRSYGYVNSTGELDITLKKLSELLPIMVKLSELEKTIKLLAQEIEKTRRRVNALEYVLIPNFKETIKYIEMRLDELERANLTKLMKIKKMIETK